MNVFSGDSTDLRPLIGHLPERAALAVVGSTELDGEWPRAVVWHVIDLLRPTVVVSGGAPGVDSLAAAAARYFRIPLDERLPDVPVWFPRNGKRGFSHRNLEIAERCSALVRIVWVGSKTYGSGWTRDRARDLGKPVAEIVLAKEKRSGTGAGT